MKKNNGNVLKFNLQYVFYLLSSKIKGGFLLGQKRFLFYIFLKIVLSKIYDKNIKSKFEKLIEL